MDYPKYKLKRSPYYGRLILIFVVLNFLLSLIIHWYTYVHGSLLFIILCYHVFRNYRGFKAFTGFILSILFMLMVFDFIDFDFSWSLDYVFPSFLIFLSVLQFFLILLKKASWKKHYDLHFYILLLNALMIILLMIGVIESNVLVIVTYSIIAVIVVLLRLRVGKNYTKDIDRFTHY